MNYKFDYVKVMEEYRTGDKKYASEVMCEHFKPLIYKIAGKYTFDQEIKEDLVQEGYVAIINAMETYDCNKSMPSTYFTPCISNAVKEYSWNSKHHVSRHYSRKILNAKKAMEEIKQQYLPITYETVAEYMEENVAETAETMNLIYTIDYSYSMDAEGVYDYCDPDDEYVTYEVEETEQELLGCFDELDDDSFSFLCKRYGIGDEEKRTRREMAIEYGITNYQVDKRNSSILASLYKSMNEKDIIDEGLLDSVMLNLDTYYKKRMKQYVS